MRNNRSKTNNQKSYTVNIETLTVKLSFPCRLFAEYQLNNKLQKTKTIQVTSKQSQYPFNENIFWDKRQEKLPLIVTFKLLSNQGLEFTAGALYIKEADIENSPVNYKVSRTADIELFCLCKFNLPEEEATSRSLEEIQ